MSDIPTPEQVEAIGDRLAIANGLAPDESMARWYRKDIAALLADHDALTARAEAAERKVAAVRAEVERWADLRRFARRASHIRARGGGWALPADDVAAQPPRFATQTPAGRDETPGADGNATRVIPTAQEGNE